MALLNDILKYHESSDAHIPVPVLKVSKHGYHERSKQSAVNFTGIHIIMRDQ